MYGKATETAIAAMTRLAEVYDAGKTLLSAAEIAESRGLQRPFVGKVLTSLSQAGLVRGSRGPGGGFTLAKPPKRIRIYDIFKIFETEDTSNACPFGGGICGVGEPCPLHDKLVNVQAAVNNVLHDTTLEVFRLAYLDRGGDRNPPERTRAGRRQSFRATTRGRGGAE